MRQPRCGWRSFLIDTYRYEYAKTWAIETCLALRNPNVTHLLNVLI